MEKVFYFLAASALALPVLLYITELYSETPKAWFEKDIDNVDYGDK